MIILLSPAKTLDFESPVAEEPTTPRFEREAALVADTAIRRHVPDDQLAAAAAQVKPLLARNRMAAACAACLNTITLQLEGRLAPARGVDDITDTLVEERGA